MGFEGQQVARLLPEFERLNPGIHVDLQQVPVLSAHEKLLTAFAGDSLPDVTPLGNTWIPEFALLDALAPLDGRIAATPGIDVRSEEHTSELQSLMRISYAVFCLKKKNTTKV